MNTLSEETRSKLAGVSVATLCTALYKRGLRNQTLQNVHPLRNAAAIWSALPTR